MPLLNPPDPPNYFMGSQTRTLGGDIYQPIMDGQTGEILGWLKIDHARALCDALNAA